MLRNYETLYIISPKCQETEINKTCKAVEDTISKTGGELIKTERWGKKRLAYEVQKNREGFYVLVHYKGPAKLVTELERNMRISEDVIRYLTVRIDDKIKILGLPTERPATEEEAAPAEEASERAETGRAPAETAPAQDGNAPAKPPAEPSSDGSPQPGQEAESSAQDTPASQPTE